MTFMRYLLMTVMFSALVAAPAYSLDDSDVRDMGKSCEAARSKALEPIRERKTQACIEQQLRSKGHCERYYKTYGNVSQLPSGSPSGGYFYDLPECREWLEAREQLRVSRSRP